ncbi:MAG: dTDP-4-dehydrorhamnose reductase [Jatrophihabitans sp.]|uniref:dTDP-4-dehydrorhamnose reductase n=1 Tax=Jatrophihabitans sp. TaxID=1932789 RepID=UPI003F7F6F15
MRFLITGAGGQLGVHLRRALVDPSDTVVALTSRELDITDSRAVEHAVRTHRPDVVINAAAYTAVDAAESDEDTAYRVNATGPALLATALAQHGGRLLHVSTDYVFAGDATLPYEPDDPTGPRTVYGRTKLAGEQAVRELLPDAGWVVRTAWVYGGPSANFVDTMLRLQGERETLDVVDDQLGCPTSAADLAAGMVELARSSVPAQTLHLVNDGQTSWCGFAREIFRLTGADPDRVHAVDTAAFPRPAPRPAWSVLSTAAWTAAGLTPPRDWRAALADHLAARD